MMKLDHDEGFTLLEVVIALAIFSLALGVLYPIFSSTHGRLAEANARAIGVSLVSSVLEEQRLLSDWGNFPKEGSANGWDWSASVEAFPHETDSEIAPGSLLKLQVTAAHTKGLWGTPVVFHRIVWVPEG